MPSIKKRVTGFIRQLSAAGSGTAGGGNPVSATGGGTSSASSSPQPSRKHQRSEEKNGDHDKVDRVGFVETYLRSGAAHPKGPEMFSGKTGHDLPVFKLRFDLEDESFAAFSGPEGGLTSVSVPLGEVDEDNEADEERSPASASEDFDFIDLDDLEPSAVKKASNNKKLKPKRACSVENDYPELGGDFPVGGRNNNGNNKTSSNQYSRNLRVLRRLRLDLRMASSSIAGIVNWYRPNNEATGLSVTLYERHPHTAEHAGAPIADSFAVIARKSSALLVLGDGVNWGAGAALASRCAVYGCVEYLNKALFGPQCRQLRTSQEVFQCLLRSFHAAHSLILQEEAQLTTLTACLVIPFGECDKDGDNEQFVACVCNVGDSLAYVYGRDGHVREITEGSHDIQSNRDMRDALGALGPVDGINPELSNLTCSMTEVRTGDIVFLTSDGVSDNFDPVVGKCCSPARTSSSSTDSPLKKPPVSNILPAVEAYQRHELTLLRMEDILNRGGEDADSEQGPVKTSAELCQRMVDFCQRLTRAKRRILEDPELYPEHTRHALPDTDAVRLDQKLRRRRVCEKLAAVPGKLDHATITAYKVGDRRQSLKHVTNSVSASSASSDIQRPPMILAPCASSEDLTFRDDLDEDSLTASASSLKSGSCESLSVTPVHRPRQDDR